MPTGFVYDEVLWCSIILLSDACWEPNDWHRRHFASIVWDSKYLTQQHNHNTRLSVQTKRVYSSSVSYS